MTLKKNNAALQAKTNSIKARLNLYNTTLASVVVRIDYMSEGPSAWRPDCWRRKGQKLYRVAKDDRLFRRLFQEAHEEEYGGLGVGKLGSW
jgi:hypothetical protein